MIDLLESAPWAVAKLCCASARLGRSHHEEKKRPNTSTVLPRLLCLLSGLHCRFVPITPAEPPSARSLDSLLLLLHSTRTTKHGRRWLLQSAPSLLCLQVLLLTLSTLNRALQPTRFVAHCHFILTHPRSLAHTVFSLPSCRTLASVTKRLS